MKRITQLLSIVGIASMLIYSCSSEYKGYKKSDSGIYYKYYVQNDGEKAQVGDKIKFHLLYSLNDSVIFDSNKRPATELLLPERQFPGDIYDCFSLLTVGDSASFIIEADSFFLVTANLPKLPPFVEPNSKLYADVMVMSIKSKEDVELEKQKFMAEMNEKELEGIDNFKQANLFNNEFIPNTGIIYKSIKNGSGNLPNPTDMIFVEYELKDLKNNVIFNSATVEEDVIFECLSENFETEGFNLILSKMHKGEKASFLVPSKLAFGEEGIPNRIEPFTTLYYTIEILDIQTKEAYTNKIESKNSSFIEVENEKIASYLKTNNITIVPRESGLYYIENKEGSGDFAKSGDKVNVHYTLFNLDDEKIDSSLDRGTPFSFTVGQGQVIPGWDEALTLMKVGGKATLIIPSKIAYGERKRSEDILPYTPLHFEVELVEIVK